MRETIGECHIHKLEDETYSLQFSDFHNNYEYLSNRGFQGGGATWERLAEGLAKAKAPEILPLVEFDAEGDCLYVYSAEKAALVRLAELITLADTNREELEQAIVLAEVSGWME